MQRCRRPDRARPGPVLIGLATLMLSEAALSASLRWRSTAPELQPALPPSGLRLSPRLAPSSSPSPEARGLDQDLYLQVFVNGQDSGLISPFQLRGGALWGDPDELRRLGLVLPETLGSQSLPLSAINGLTVELDMLRQQLRLGWPAERLAGTRFDAARATELQPQVTPGVVLNYDLYAQQRESSADAGTLRSGSGLFELRGFGQRGQWLQSGLWRSRAEEAGGDGWLRLQSTWFHTDAERLESWQVGDLISGASLSWTQPVRLGGVQWQRNFRLQPQLITFPLPTVEGTVAVPSTVDVLVNQVRQFSQPVQPGPFLVENLPVITGQGEIQVVVRDALGREQVSLLPFYASSRLLRPGLRDFSLETGWLRRSFGQRSADYGERPVALASLRQGWADSLTLEAHAELGPELVNGGLGGVLRLGGWGLGSLALAYGRDDRGEGLQTHYGYQWTARRFGLSASGSQAGRGYRNLASLEGLSLPPRQLHQLVASVGLGRVGLSVGWIDLRAAEGLRTHLATLSASATLGAGWSAFASLITGLERADRDALALGVRHYFGRQRSLSATRQHREGGADLTLVQAVQALPAQGVGAGWQLQAAESGRVQAAAAYRFPALTAGLGRFEDRGPDTSYAELGGALAWLACACAPRAANRIDDSFILVDTGLPGVPVLHENRAVGISDDDGLLLVPGALSLVRNQIAIDPRGLALDVTVPKVRETVVPRERSGVYLDLGIRQQPAALLELQQPDGTPVPLGARLTLNAVPIDAVVGYDGLAYVHPREGHNQLQVRWEGGACEVPFTHVSRPGELVQHGPLRCEVQAP